VFEDSQKKKGIKQFVCKNTGQASLKTTQAFCTEGNTKNLLQVRGTCQH